MTTTIAELWDGDGEEAAADGPTGGGTGGGTGFAATLAVADAFCVAVSSGTMTVASVLPARAAAASEDVVDAAALIASANSSAF